MNISDRKSERYELILEAALEAFGRYGFARTRMDDIAQTSGIARTALYRIYRNKQDIFRALAEAVHLQALDKTKKMLNGKGSFATRLENALIARDLHLLNIGHTGPHADEIAELYSSLAGDLAAHFNADLADMIAKETRQAVVDKEYTLPDTYQSPDDFAVLLRMALEGIKKEEKNPRRFEPLARQMIQSLCRG